MSLTELAAAETAAVGPLTLFPLLCFNSFQFCSLCFFFLFLQSILLSPTLCVIPCVEVEFIGNFCIGYCIVWSIFLLLSFVFVQKCFFLVYEMVVYADFSD